MNIEESDKDFYCTSQYPLLGENKLSKLVLVQSPLQYLNVLEYIASSKSNPEEYCLVLLLSAWNKRSTAQLDRLMGYYQIPWGHTERIEAIIPANKLGKRYFRRFFKEYRSARTFATRIRNLLRSIPKMNSVILADYRSREMQHVCFCLRSASITLLDDGSVTHQIIRIRNGDTQNISEKIMFSNGWRTLRLRLLCKIYFSRIESVRFFTHYDHPAPKGDSLQKHDYSFLRTQVEGNEIKDEHWFIGMSHVETGMVSTEEYLNLMSRVREDFGTPLFYVAHRNELEAKLHKIQELGYRILKLDFPIEVELIARKYHPKTIVGVASSAIDNLSIIYKDKIKIVHYSISSGYRLKKLSSHYHDIVNYHAKNVNGNIEVRTI